MVLPDSTRFEQDTTPGLVRDLHHSIAAGELVYRNQPEIDYGKLVTQPKILSTQCDEGYALGVPYGRHLKVYYEFDAIEPLRRQLASLLNDLGALATEHSACQRMVLEYTDFPNRHHVDPALVGADFEDPVQFSLMRCRDVREQEIPDAPEDVLVRPAGESDADAVGALEERVAAEGAIAPPLPDRFFSDARWVGVAEVKGALAGYLRLLDGERRGMVAEEFLVDPEGDSASVGAALLHAAFEHGRADNRRGLTLRVADEALGDPLIKAYGFKYADAGLSYVRPSDPVEVQRQHDEKITTRIKVGKIFGMFT